MTKFTWDAVVTCVILFGDICVAIVAASVAMVVFKWCEFV
jgi:hypothetical protein